MENLILTSIKNPLIKQVRKLQRAKERQQQNLLLIEGTNSIEAACRANYQLDTIFYTARWQESHQQLWQAIARQNCQTQEVSAEVLSAIATTVNPDGVVAIAPRSVAEPTSIDRLGIALERLQDPGNLGTIIRSASAVNADGLWLSDGSVDIYSPKVLRASAGQWFQTPIASRQNLREFMQQQQQRRIQIVATTAKATKTYWEADFTRPSLVLLGNEAAGLSPELIELADERVSIPLANGVESLNVAVATALLLYEAQRQWSSLIVG